jgi:Cu/Ag efflux protein CusF
MKKSITIALGLALAAGLAACGQQGEASKPAQDTAAPAKDVGAVAMPDEIRHGKGTGSVTAIDTTAGQVTLDHGAIAELEWPPMAMSFAVKPGLLKDIKVGDKIAFELDWDGKAGTVTKINKIP